MAKQPKKAKDGRANNTAPFKDIDWDTVDKLCAIHCTRDEIAEIVGCDPKTLLNHAKRLHGCTFEEYIARKSSPGKVSLRRQQYKLAMEGDRTMLVWLGKQWLGQKDSKHVESSIKVEKSVEDYSDNELLGFLRDGD